MIIETVKLTEGGYVLNGNLFVPDVPGNRHYNAVQRWIAEGNSPAAADAVTAPEPSDAEVLRNALRTKGVLSASDLSSARSRVRG